MSFLASLVGNKKNLKAQNFFFHDEIPNYGFLYATCRSGLASSTGDIFLITMRLAEIQPEVWCLMVAVGAWPQVGGGLILALPN